MRLPPNSAARCEGAADGLSCTLLSFHYRENRTLASVSPTVPGVRGGLRWPPLWLLRLTPALPALPPSSELAVLGPSDKLLLPRFPLAFRPGALCFVSRLPGLSFPRSLLAHCSLCARPVLALFLCQWAPSPGLWAPEFSTSAVCRLSSGKRVSHGNSWASTPEVCVRVQGRDQECTCVKRHLGDSAA